MNNVHPIFGDSPSAQLGASQGRVDGRVRLSVVIPCFNEERTLEGCVDELLRIADDGLELELIVVDDCSTDQSYQVARALTQRIPCMVLLQHSKNMGKGAALRTGFAAATGDFVAVQDADREYDPMDLKRLLEPLRVGKADVVLGSRFLSAGCHRVLYFWHAVGNKFLTLLSNMLTDLNLTDMETCYKVFRREIIQSIRLEEDRFGFEPEVVAKVARLRVRLYEMGISYSGRTYAEGKKIGMRDGWRALYCVLRYNLPHAPVPLQLAVYLVIGGIAALVNLALFMTLYGLRLGTAPAILLAFSIAAVVNYFLSIAILFRHGAKWKTLVEVILFVCLVSVVGTLDFFVTRGCLSSAIPPALSKLIATAAGFVLNFSGRRFLVFPEKGNLDWMPAGPSRRAAPLEQHPTGGSDQATPDDQRRLA